MAPTANCPKNPALGRASCSWRYLRRRFLVFNEMPTAKAFCRTAPSERLSLPPMRLAGVFFRAIALSVRRSLFDQSRRTFLLAPAISIISVCWERLLVTQIIRCQPTNRGTCFKSKQHSGLSVFLFCFLLNTRSRSDRWRLPRRNVRFGALSGLKSDMPGCPRGAIGDIGSPIRSPHRHGRVAAAGSSGRASLRF
jgi:hypothetical protein